MRETRRTLLKALALSPVAATAARAQGPAVATAKPIPSTGEPIPVVGLALLLFSVTLQPALGPLLRRPWSQTEVAGLAPDPTVLASLGVLLLSAARNSRGPAWLLWPPPLLWCANAGMTLATMHAADAFVLPAAPVLALWAAVAKRSDGRAT